MKKLIFLLVAMVVSINCISTANAKTKHKRHHHYHVNKIVKKVDYRQIKLNEMMSVYDENTSSGFFAIEKLRREYVYKEPVKVKKPTFAYEINYGRDLVAEASKYLGLGARQLGLPKNLWCADFMNMLVGGHDRAAASYLSRGKQANYGCVNCVAVLVRRGGNHVGIVSGYDEDGDPIIISGNHDGVVGIGAYRREKVIGYRSI